MFNKAKAKPGRPKKLKKNRINVKFKVKASTLRPNLTVQDSGTLQDVKPTCQEKIEVAEENPAPTPNHLALQDSGTLQEVKPNCQEKIEVSEENLVPTPNPTATVQDSGTLQDVKPNCQENIDVAEENSDPDNSRRLGVDEQYIKFRPSPNFKNMRKFLKSKIDHSESSSQSPPNGSSEQTTPNTVPESPPAQQQMEKPPVTPVIHPPLPLEPPPPNNPLLMPVPIKNEVIDNDYEQQENGHESPNLSTTAAESDEASLRLSLEAKTNEPNGAPTEKPRDICRDYVRGTCVRAHCRFLHQRDLKQLSGIYTFCRNFQNSVCTLPMCKYVHATVFEEQEFYRTGNLPVDVQKQKTFYMLPPPPPPPPPPEEPTPEVQNASALSPRQLNVPDKPLISCVPVSKLESKPAENDFRNMLQAITSPLQRDWSSISSLSPPQRDLENKENYKKCKDCENNYIREQYNKDKVEHMEISSKETRMRSLLIDKKTNVMYNVLSAVIKQEITTTGGLHSLVNKLSMSGEKYRDVLQHLFDSACDM